MGERLHTPKSDSEFTPEKMILGRLLPYFPLGIGNFSGPFAVKLPGSTKKNHAFSAEDHVFGKPKNKICEATEKYGRRKLHLFQDYPTLDIPMPPEVKGV